MSNNCWLPKCEYYNSSQPWTDYEDLLYSIFKTDFIDSYPEFEGKEIRIRWVRAFIENYDCDTSKCTDCDGIKVWEKPFKNNQRIHLFFEEERYIVVLERRENYILLITAFYIEYEHTLEKKVKEFQLYKAKSE